MRVLFIVTAYKRNEKDVITPWMSETILQLKRRDVEVQVYAPSYKGLCDHTVDGVRVRRFRYFFSRWESLTHEQTAPDRFEKGLFSKILVVFYLIGGIIGMIKLANRERFDILQAHWPLPSFLFAYVGKKLTKARIISSFHGVEVRWVKNKLPFLKFFLRWTIKSSDAITANTPTTADEVKSIQETKVNVIPYSVGLKSEASREDAAAIETDSSNPILFVGRLVERKGVDYLLQALRLVRERHDAKAVIVGDGADKDKLVRLARDLEIDQAVTFAGFVDEGLLVRYFKECSMFVLPAVFDKKGDTEGQGVVILEAMSFKKPVVASRVGGIRDIVVDGETGILVGEKDSQGLSAAISTLLENKDVAREMGLRGYELYRRTYSWDSITEKWRRLYGEVIAGERL